MSSKRPSKDGLFLLPKSEVVIAHIRVRERIRHPEITVHSPVSAPRIQSQVSLFIIVVTHTENSMPTNNLLVGLWLPNPGLRNTLIHERRGHGKTVKYGPASCQAVFELVFRKHPVIRCWPVFNCIRISFWWGLSKECGLIIRPN